MQVGEATVSYSHESRDTVSISFNAFEELRKCNLKTCHSDREKVRSINAINVANRPFVGRYKSVRRLSNASHIDERVYIKIYDEIIFPACSSEILKRLHEHTISPRTSTSTCTQAVTSCTKTVTSSSSSVTSGLTDSTSESTDEHVIADTKNGSVNSETKIRLSDLVVFELEYFEHLLTALCSNRRRLSSRQMELDVLEVILTTDGLRVHRNIVNMKLSFGDTPVIRASRVRDYDVISLLLRHGADVNQGWLEFKNSLEILLFSPTQRYVSNSDICAIEQCLPLILTACKGVSVSRLEQLEGNSYFPLHPNWRAVLREAMCSAWECCSVVPSLKHLCRCTVRGSVQPSSEMIVRINELPLPNILKRYLTFEDMKVQTASMWDRIVLQM